MTFSGVLRPAPVGEERGVTPSPGTSGVADCPRTPVDPIPECPQFVELFQRPRFTEERPQREECTPTKPLSPGSWKRPPSPCTKEGRVFRFPFSPTWVPTRTWCGRRFGTRIGSGTTSRRPCPRHPDPGTVPTGSHPRHRPSSFRDGRSVVGLPAGRSVSPWDQTSYLHPREPPTSESTPVVESPELHTSLPSGPVPRSHY